MNDHALLRDFADMGSQAAFRQLVERHVALVYSAARRRLNDAHLAEDATQQVFALLARKARGLPASVVISGWLYRTACHIASETWRREHRRQQREVLAVQAMKDSSADATWREIEPLLDDAMGELRERDRDAVVLRYFENRPLREVGAALGIGEDAAQKRVGRALEKLRAFFARRGKVVAAGALTGALSGGAIQAAPAGLAHTVAGFVLSSTAAAVSTSTLGSLMSLTTAKSILAGTMALGAATVLVVQHLELRHLRAERQAALQRAQAAESAAAAARGETKAAALAAENDPRNAELARLRGQVVALRRRQAELESANAQLSRAVRGPGAAASASEPGTPEAEAFRAAAIAKMTYAKQWMLAFILFANDHGDRYPRSFEEASSYFRTEDASAGLKPEQFELLYQGMATSITNPASRIVLREVEPFASAERPGLSRTYGFADGHTEIHYAADGDFGPWESQHGVGGDRATPAGGQSP